MEDDKVEIPKKVLWLLSLVQLLLLLAFFSLGKYQESTIPCDHNKSYEVKTTGGGIMLLIPPGWGVAPVLNKYSRPYMIPTDEEG